MFRTINAILVCTSIAALIGVYGLKYAVEDTASEKVRIERHIDRQESELSLLQADWAYLNQPAHVAPIVARHAAALGLLPTKPQQFGSITDLPMRPIVQVDDSGLDGLFQSLEAGVDPIETLIEASE